MASAGSGSDAAVVFPTLLEGAADIMMTPDTDAKASKSLELAAAWVAGALPIMPRTEDGKFRTVRCPTTPARPETVELVDGSKLKSGTKKAMLHSLVHAESYAIDLSWDIMLRFAAHGKKGFPEAVDVTALPDSIGGDEVVDADSVMPKEFFDDWVKVAKEEAEHYTKWNVRLQELGSRYGELKAHDGLWQSAMETADDLLARLAIVHMTHEARGLDVYPAMVAKLRKSDDSQSIDILNGNYQEEITHVGAGYRWFQYVCSERGLEATPTFHDMVKSRFRGFLKPPFNVEARTKAGMPAEFYEPLTRAAIEEAEAKVADPTAPTVSAAE